MTRRFVPWLAITCAIGATGGGGFQRMYRRGRGFGQRLSRARDVLDDVAADLEHTLKVGWTSRSAGDPRPVRTRGTVFRIRRWRRVQS